MFVEGHLGKLGTGPLSSCEEPLNIYAESITDHLFDWHLAYDYGMFPLKWYDGRDCGWGSTNDANPLPLGGHLSAFRRCAISTEEIVVINEKVDPSSITKYRYIDTLGELSAFYADSHDDDPNVIVYGYAAKPNGDLYLFEGSSGAFTQLTNLGEVARCLCRVVYDPSYGYKPYGFILTNTGKLYRIFYNNVGSITLLKTKVVGLGPTVFANSGLSVGYTPELVITDVNGDVYLYNIETESMELYTSNLPGVAYGLLKTDNGVEELCYYNPDTDEFHQAYVDFWEGIYSGPYVIYSPSVQPEVIVKDTPASEGEYWHMTAFISTIPDDLSGCTYLDIHFSIGLVWEYYAGEAAHRDQRFALT